MVYACRICQYDEIAENKCVYRNDLLTVTKYVSRRLPFLPLNICFSHSGSRRESRLTSARIRLWCVPLISETASHINRRRLTVIGSFEHDLPELRECRVRTYFLEWH